MEGDRFVNTLRFIVTVAAAILLVLLTADDAGFGTVGGTGHGQMAEVALNSEQMYEQNDEFQETPAMMAPGGVNLIWNESLGEWSTVTSDGQTDETQAKQPEAQPAVEQPGTTAGEAAAGTQENNVGKEPQKIAYITIDDGPSRDITPGMLDVLEQEGIKATFFVLPHGGVSDLYRRIIDEGHEIGNHSYSHVYTKLYNVSDLDAFIDDISMAREYIQDNYDYQTTTFRFPGGSMGRSAAVLQPRKQVLDEMGYRYFDWNSDAGDAGRGADKSAAALTRNVIDNTQGRERLIVLMHDAGDKVTTLEALPMIIEGLREQGYVFDVLRNYNTPAPNN